MLLYTPNMTAGRGRKPCPPHGPHLVSALEEGSWVAQCLACGWKDQSVKTLWMRSGRLTKH
jgi:hypothetical protein